HLKEVPRRKVWIGELQLAPVNQIAQIGRQFGCCYHWASSERCDSEFRKAVGFPDDHPIQREPRRRHHCPHERLAKREQALSSRQPPYLAFLQWRGDLLADRGNYRGEEALLVAELAIDRDARSSRNADDVVQCGSSIATLHEHRLRRFEECASTPFATAFRLFLSTHSQAQGTVLNSTRYVSVLKSTYHWAEGKMLSAEFTCSVGYDQDIPCVTMVLKGYAT